MEKTKADEILAILEGMSYAEAKKCLEGCLYDITVQSTVKPTASS